jgi:hypothetical protein
MPTTESNARTIADSRGYRIEIRRTGSIVILTAEGQRVHTAARWSEALRFLVAAPRIDDGGPEAA